MTRTRPVPASLSVAASSLLLVCAAAAALELYVAPDGDDADLGTRDHPFATIGHAQEAVRAAEIGHIGQSITVYLRGGTYRTVQPLVFGPQDGGTAEHSVTYAAYADEQPVISGARPIRNWREADDGAWIADLPDAAAGNWRFRELFVNGRRAVRARYPDNGYLHIEKAFADRRSGFFAKPGDIDTAMGLVDAEVVLLHDWSITRIPVERFDSTARSISFIGPIGRKYAFLCIDHFDKHPRYFIENCKECLDAPGEWYLDAAKGEVRYRPRAGEALSSADVVAPACTALIRVHGDTDLGLVVRNLHFQGIIFEHCGFTFKPNTFYCGVQAAFHLQDAGESPRRPVPAALLFELARDCGLTDCVVRHVGGSGIWFGRQSRDNTIERCVVSDVSGNGIMIGEPRERHVNGKPWTEAAPEQVASGNVVRNCLIERVGQQFYGAVGVWTGIAADTLIAHNEVRQMPYTGISVGWRWDAKPTPCKANRIENNHIHDVMQTLSDGGGIYTLGLQPGSGLRGNYIHDIPANAGRAESNGMFLDQGTTDFLIEGNVIEGVDRSPLRFHMATTNLVRRNVLYTQGSAPPIRYNSTKPDDIYKADNTVLKRTSPRWTPGLSGRALQLDGGQCIDVPHDPRLEPKELTLAAWIRLQQFPNGRDRRSWVVSKNKNEWENGHYGIVLRDDGKVGAYLNIGGTQRNGFDAFTGPDTLQLGAWHHVAMTYDGDVLLVYCDGREAARTSIGRERQSGSGHLSIGRRPDGYTYYQGQIDEVMLFDRALSQQDIATVAQAATTGPELPTTVLAHRIDHWGFDDASPKEDAQNDAADAIRKHAGPQQQPR